MLWFWARGAVFVPLGHSPDYDLVADWGWNGLVKRLDPSRYDLLFALVGDGGRWLMPAQEVGGGRCIYLGGPTYADFEIDPDPIGLKPRRSE